MRLLDLNSYTKLRINEHARILSDVQIEQIEVRGTECMVDVSSRDAIIVSLRALRSVRQLALSVPADASDSDTRAILDEIRSTFAC